MMKFKQAILYGSFVRSLGKCKSKWPTRCCCYCDFVRCSEFNSSKNGKMKKTNHYINFCICFCVWITSFNSINTRWSLNCIPITGGFSPIYLCVCTTIFIVLTEWEKKSVRLFELFYIYYFVFISLFLFGRL